MDRLDELAIFVAIVDQGSLAAAARRLRRSAPAVTRALAGLEDRAGVRLIERTTRRLAPTEAGRLLAERARSLIADYEAAMSGLSEVPVRGLLRVTAPIQFGRLHVAPIVASFLDAHPETQVELVLADRNLDLIEDGLDVAVRIDHLADSSLAVRRVGAVRRVLVASPAYLAARGIPESPADLAGHDTIFGSPRTDVREWRFGADGAGTVVRLAPRLLVNEIEAQLIAVRAGRGIARVLSYQVAEEVAAGRLVRLLKGHEPPPIPVQLVARGGAHRPPKIAAFLDHAAERLRRLPVIREEA
ncbi:DNA-binding transcriptional LysR family regulator [Methylobacterium sp. BE186]|uniref:LysR family transcriptional regulator n=1 Tax=Methylobacterium sp. BE186 TaxID=2817715 RepID=UPI002855DE40|nr:LysR family transcriptional regulator [Methylobacterium sp. BE186]MDR7036315.1 DNA-binding transcriptional LysR family regulator [Methylobacterium sp. BE186]